MSSNRKKINFSVFVFITSNEFLLKIDIFQSNFQLFFLTQIWKTPPLSQEIDIFTNFFHQIAKYKIS